MLYAHVRKFSFCEVFCFGEDFVNIKRRDMKLLMQVDRIAAGTHHFLQDIELANPIVFPI
jgi:hypothetical protein